MLFGGANNRKNRPSRRRTIRVDYTYLEMLAAPEQPAAGAPESDLLLVHLRNPSVAFYRYLYNTVGEDFLWYERRIMEDGPLREIIENPAIEIYVLYRNGEPAGFAELDFIDPVNVKLAYFGLLPNAIGHRLGRYLLESAIDMAWSRSATKRLSLHTCSLDHPAALINYEKRGFKVYQHRSADIVDPRTIGILSADASIRPSPP